MIKYYIFLIIDVSIATLYQLIVQKKIDSIKFDNNLKKHEKEKRIKREKNKLKYKLRIYVLLSLIIFSLMYKIYPPSI